MYSQRYTLGGEDKLTVLIPQTLNTLYAQDKNLKCFINVQNRTNKVLEFTSRNNPVFAVNPKADFSFEVPNSAFSDLKFVVNITELDNTLINDYSNDILVTFTIGSSLGYGNNYNTNYYNLSNIIRRKLNIPMWSPYKDPDKTDVPIYKTRAFNDNETTKDIVHSEENVVKLNIDERYINTVRIYGNIFYHLAIIPISSGGQTSEDKNKNIMKYTYPRTPVVNNNSLRGWGACIIPGNYELIGIVNKYLNDSQVQQNGTIYYSGYDGVDTTLKLPAPCIINSSINIYKNNESGSTTSILGVPQILDTCNFSTLQLNDIYYTQYSSNVVNNIIDGVNLAGFSVQDKIVKSSWDIGKVNTVDVTFDIKNIANISQLKVNIDGSIYILTNYSKLSDEGIRQFEILVSATPDLYFELN